MLSTIADVLKSKLDSLEWLERFGGLVFPATRPEFITDADGKQVVVGYQSYPVACSVNMENCWEQNRFRHFEPDASKAAIAFFMDNGGVTLRRAGGSNISPTLEFDFSLKLVFWLNTARLGEDITGGGCLPSGRLAPYVIARLFGQHSAAGLFGGEVEEDIFRNIEVRDIRQLPKAPAMFEPFTFARAGVDRNLFIYPYDYFGLSINGVFEINTSCLPEFGQDWEPNVNCLVPPTSSAWIDPRFVLWLIGLPEFASNEDALAGIAPDGSATDGISVGDPYRASANHVGTFPGSLIVVT